MSSRFDLCLTCYFYTTNTHQRGNSISEILTAFIESCCDFIKDDKSLEVANLYWNDLIQYYSSTISTREKKEIRSTTLDLLSTASSVTMDNNLMEDMWANILYSLYYNKVMFLRDIDQMNLEELIDDDYKAIFKIFKKLIQYAEGNKINGNEKDAYLEEEIRGLNLVKNKQNVFDEIINKKDNEE